MASVDVEIKISDLLQGIRDAYVRDREERPEKLLTLRRWGRPWFWRPCYWRLANSALVVWGPLMLFVRMPWLATSAYEEGWCAGWLAEHQSSAEEKRKAEQERDKARHLLEALKDIAQEECFCVEGDRSIGQVGSYYCQTCRAKDAIAETDPAGKPILLCLDDPCDEPVSNDGLLECHECGATYPKGGGCPREHLHDQDDV